MSRLLSVFLLFTALAAPSASVAAIGVEFQVMVIRCVEPYYTTDVGRYGGLRQVLRSYSERILDTATVKFDASGRFEVTESSRHATLRVSRALVEGRAPRISGTLTLNYDLKGEPTELTTVFYFVDGDRAPSVYESNGGCYTDADRGKVRMRVSLKR